jgi:hypothetical protein
MMMLSAVVTAALAAVGVSCAPVADPVPVPTLYVVAEGEPITFDAVSGDRIDVEMVAEGDVAGRCADMGGRLFWTDDEHTSAHYVCAEVDF